MSFVLSHALSARIIVVCIAPDAACHVDCEMARHSLGVRTSARRPALLWRMFSELGELNLQRDNYSIAGVLSAALANEWERPVSTCGSLLPPRPIPQRAGSLNVRTFCESCSPAFRASDEQCELRTSRDHAPKMRPV
eukprot:5335746-Prymnesium_polylepis.1